MRCSIVRSPTAEDRLERAADWLALRGPSEEVLVIGASYEAATTLARRVARRTGASFGWQRSTLGRVASALAAPDLTAGGLAPVGALGLEALCARVVDRLRKEDGGLGRFATVAEYPGLPRALARTLAELRLAGIDPARLSAAGPELVRIHEAYVEEMAAARLADRAVVLRFAAAVARRGGMGIGIGMEGGSVSGGAGAILGRPILLLDVPLSGALEGELIAALADRAPSAFATVPTGDERSRALVEAAFGVASTSIERTNDAAASSLARLQSYLFSDAVAPRDALGDDITILSAPGESRECVELARAAQHEAARGVPFDRMAILLRAPGQYRAHLEEALRRAGLPAYFAKGSVRPDPAGRAFVALLGCAASQLSARRFAEYLSLGQVPDLDPSLAADPPPSLPPTDRWVRPDEELVQATVARGASFDVEPDQSALDELAAVAADAERRSTGSTPATRSPEETPPRPRRARRAPRRWEKLLLESAVIGGLDRWDARLAALQAKLAADLHEYEQADDAAADRTRRSLDDLDAFRRFSLPLLQAIDALPWEASWGVWIEQLSALATRALRRPDRVLSVLAELTPMADVGPVTLADLRLVLSRRLTELVVAPDERAAGRIFVAPIEAARGLAFDVVMVPGLAEKLFPQRVLEDPILLDEARVALDLGLDTNHDRVAGERLALRLAVGAARRRLVISYPRVDLEQSRPRVPSFYALEILRAAEGELPGFDELARRAEQGGSARIGWPAPSRPSHAIDEAEYDLALLETLFHRPERETIGAAHYLLTANDHLARALRFRARRWTLKKWAAADGMIDPVGPARAALDRHGLAERSFSPTALQHFASCPYKFFLYAVHKLAPRKAPDAIEDMDPLQRGSLVHDTLFELHAALREEDLLPVTEDTLDRARVRLDEVLDRVAARTRDELAPAIDRVWDDGIAGVRADLREWLRRASQEQSFAPWRFELSFGLRERRARDPASTPEPVELDCGIRLRGSIDLVERGEGGELRATDYKTGRAHGKVGATVVGGGKLLQPVFYGLALEKLFPQARVTAGRLYFCTSQGGFEEVPIPIDDEARRAAGVVADVIGRALSEGFFPAAPDKGACDYCDYRPVCGPYEETRAARKSPERLHDLRVLRGLR